MTGALAVVCGVMGLCVGSFLNVVTHRVPRSESVVRPRSHCPACGVQIAERDNIPVVSWVLLGGRCRACRSAISLRYPAVELATGALWLAAGLRFGAAWVLPAFLVFVAGLVAVSVTDIEHFLIPKRIIYPTLFVAGPLLIVGAVLGGAWRDLERAGVGGVVAFVAFYAISFAYPAGMAFGDVRLAGVIGVFLGWLGYGVMFFGFFAAWPSSSPAGRPARPPSRSACSSPSVRWWPCCGVNRSCTPGSTGDEVGGRSHPAIA